MDYAIITYARVVSISIPWGQVYSLDALKAAIAEHKPKVLGIVHAETSTGKQCTLIIKHN